MIVMKKLFFLLVLIFFINGCISTEGNLEEKSYIRAGMVDAFSSYKVEGFGEGKFSLIASGSFHHSLNYDVAHNQAWHTCNNYEVLNEKRIEITGWSDSHEIDFICPSIVKKIKDGKKAQDESERLRKEIEEKRKREEEESKSKDILAKIKFCEEIGFIGNLEKIGDCVLDLIKIEKDEKKYIEQSSNSLNLTDNSYNEELVKSNKRQAAALAQQLQIQRNKEFDIMWNRYTNWKHGKCFSYLTKPWECD